MSTLFIELRTGNDDLRGDCWANFYVKLTADPQPQAFEHFVGGQPRNGRTWNQVDVPGFIVRSQIEFFQILHVSVENFPETADNWDLDLVAIYDDPAAPALAGQPVRPVPSADTSALPQEE